jgi:hypothetical protein
MSALGQKQTLAETERSPQTASGNTGKLRKSPFNLGGVMHLSCRAHMTARLAHTFSRLFAKRHHFTRRRRRRWLILASQRQSGGGEPTDDEDQHCPEAHPTPTKTIHVTAQRPKRRAKQNKYENPAEARYNKSENCPVERRLSAERFSRFWRFGSSVKFLIHRPYLIWSRGSSLRISAPHPLAEFLALLG